MTALIKADPRDLIFSEWPSAAFVEWAYEKPTIALGERAFWFATETSGGFGLYAMGRLATAPEEAGDRSGKLLIRFRAEFKRFGPEQPLGKSDFAALPRLGSGSPIQRLNRLLYINSHNKVTNVDDDTADYLTHRFVN